ncbi:hypothetical protein [Microbacterium xylanilyticum]
MSSNSPRVVAVRNGRVQHSGSWLYVWIDVDTGEVAYVGGTGVDPELRAYLHVTSEDPEIGRVRATVPGYDERDFDVLAFELADDVHRPAAKRALTACLTDRGATSELREVIDPIVQAVFAHRASAGRESASS